MNKTERRNELFNLFSSNLAIYMPNQPEWFLCPICHRAFPRELIAHLDLSHIFPEFLGGTTTTLLCRKCNNTLGTKIEGHEAARIRSNDRLGDPLSPPHQVTLTPVSPTVDGRPVTAYLKVQTNTPEEIPRLEFSLQDGHTNPVDAQRLMDLIRTASEEGNLDYSLNVHIDYGYRKDRAELTYLAYAFLHLFHYLGYEWALSSLGEIVRQQLLNPEPEVIRTHIVRSVTPASAANLIFIQEPIELRGHLVPIPGTSMGENANVWLPPMYDEYPDRLPVRADAEKIVVRCFAFPEGEIRLKKTHSWWLGVQYDTDRKVLFSRT